MSPFQKRPNQSPFYIRLTTFCLCTCSISDFESGKYQQTCYLPCTKKKTLQLSAHCLFNYFSPNCNDPLPILEFTRYFSINGCGKGEFNSLKRCCHLTYLQVKNRNRIWFIDSSIIPFMQMFPAVFRGKQVSALLTTAQNLLGEGRVAQRKKQPKGRNILQRRTVSQAPPHDAHNTIMLLMTHSVRLLYISQSIHLTFKINKMA